MGELDRGTTVGERIDVYVLGHFTVDCEGFLVSCGCQISDLFRLGPEDVVLVRVEEVRSIVVDRVGCEFIS